MKTVSRLFSKRAKGCMAAAAAMLIGLAAPAAFAQKSTPDNLPDGLFDQKDDSRGSHGGESGIGPDGRADLEPDAGGDEAKKKAEQRALLRPPGQTLPDDPGERDRLLDNLYAHLATAKSKAVANRVALNIKRLWMHSGSDTVALLMSRALAAAKTKKPEKALKFLDYVVKLAPDYAEGWNQRAYVHFQQNNINRAMGDLRRVLALDPNHYKAMEGLGQILREINEKRAALKVFRALIGIHPFAEGVQKLIDLLQADVEGQPI